MGRAIATRDEARDGRDVPLAGWQEDIRRHEELAVEGTVRFVVAPSARLRDLRHEGSSGPDFVRRACGVPHRDHPPVAGDLDELERQRPAGRSRESRLLTDHQLELGLPEDRLVLAYGRRHDREPEPERTRFVACRPRWPGRRRAGGRGSAADQSNRQQDEQGAHRAGTTIRSGARLRQSSASMPTPTTTSVAAISRATSSWRVAASPSRTDAQPDTSTTADSRSGATIVSGARV